MTLVRSVHQKDSNSTPELFDQSEMTIHIDWCCKPTTNSNLQIWYLLRSRIGSGVGGGRGGKEGGLGRREGWGGGRGGEEGGVGRREGGVGRRHIHYLCWCYLQTTHMCAVLANEIATCQNVHCMEFWFNENKR